MKNIILIIINCLFVVNAQDTWNAVTSIRSDNFSFDSTEIESSWDLSEKKLDSIVIDFNNLYDKGYYKSIKVICKYLDKDIKNFSKSAKQNNQLLSYLVEKGMLHDYIHIEYIREAPNPYTKNQPNAFFIILYDDWNGEYPEGTEPMRPCNWKEGIKTQTQLKDFIERCGFNPNIPKDEE